MDKLIVKKKEYEFVEEVSSYIARVTRDGKEYLVYHFENHKEDFDNFKFASKRLRNCGVPTPEVLVIDKKGMCFLVEPFKKETVFDMLVKEDLEEKIIEEVFVLNYKARVNKMNLDFNPQNFVWDNGVLIYTPFTFTSYTRDQDFSQKQLFLWFYTKEFEKMLKENNLPLQKNRLKNEFERNKEIVLLTVKYFR